MNSRAKIIREMIGRMPLTEAENILKKNLSEREFFCVYHSRDVAGTYDLMAIAERLNTTESNIKKIRKRAYERLAGVIGMHVDLN